MINIAISAFFDVISNYIETTTVATGALFKIQYITQMIFFMAHQLLSPMFTLYIMQVNGSGVRRKHAFFILFMVPVTISLILLLLNPINGYMFVFDEQMNFVRGPYEWIIYAIGCGYLFASIFFMIRYSGAVSHITNVILFYFFSFTISGIVIQIVYSEMQVELFFESITMLGLMLTIQNKEDLLDPISHAYNRRAFVSECNRMMKTNHKIACITLKITNLRYYARIFNYEAYCEFIQNFCKWIGNIDRNAEVFHINNTTFTIMYLYDDKKETDILVERIRDRFSRGWEYNEVTYNLNLLVSLTYIPEDTFSVNTVLDMADEPVSSEQAGVHLSDNMELVNADRRAKIEQALTDALEYNRFEVYYQPIWSSETQKIVAAEALLRLNDPHLGFIPPDEMIPVAERNGMIYEIGNMVMDKVCAFLAREDVKRLGLSCIEVNLSVYQLIMKDLSGTFTAILNKYGISPSQVNLEITETASMYDNASVITSINELRHIGFLFSLDDFGTGYSNLSNIISLDFVNIKSDKALLWDSDANDVSRTLLGDTIRMMRHLDKNVIQEGVETKSQLDFVLSAGANRIQGYYFSKPLPGEEFILYVRKTNKIS